MLLAETTQLIDLVALSLSVLVFSVAAVADFRSREVKDRLWVFYGLTGTILTSVRFLLKPSQLTLLSITLTCIIALSLLFLGFIGGADSKAFICLAATLPLNPSTLRPLIGYVLPFFPITVLISSFVLSAVTSIWIAMRNARSYIREGGKMFQGFDQESWYKKLMATLIGFRVDQEKLRENNFLYPIEIADSLGSSGRRFKLSFNACSDREQEVTQLLSSLKADPYAMVWATPALPMLLFALIGLLLTITVGDFVMGAIFVVITHAPR